MICGDESPENRGEDPATQGRDYVLPQHQFPGGGRSFPTGETPKQVSLWFEGLTLSLIADSLEGSTLRFAKTTSTRAYKLRRVMSLQPFILPLRFHLLSRVGEQGIYAGSPQTNATYSAHRGWDTEKKGWNRALYGRFQAVASNGGGVLTSGIRAGATTPLLWTPAPARAGARGSGANAGVNGP